MGIQGLEGRRARGVGPDLARAARPSTAACEGKTDAVGDATLTPRFARGRGRHGGLQRQGNPARQRPRRLGNDGGEYSLTIAGERNALASCAELAMSPSGSFSTGTRPAAGPAMSAVRPIVLQKYFEHFVAQH